MKEYIDRNEVLEWKETITTDDYSGNETMDVVVVEEILDIEPADVIERSKIDKAINEMKEEYDNFAYSANKKLGASFGIRKAIDILEKNLGEINE